MTLEGFKMWYLFLFNGLFRLNPFKSDSDGQYKFVGYTFRDIIGLVKSQKISE